MEYDRPLIFKTMLMITVLVVLIIACAIVLVHDYLTNYGNKK
jgi:hypothetical protein